MSIRPLCATDLVRTKVGIHNVRVLYLSFSCEKPSIPEFSVIMPHTNDTSMVEIARVLNIFTEIAKSCHENVQIVCCAVSTINWHTVSYTAVCKIWLQEMVTCTLSGSKRPSYPTQHEILSLLSSYSCSWLFTVKIFGLL